MSAVLQEIVGVNGDNSGLIGLRHISKHDIDHPWKRSNHSARLEFGHQDKEQSSNSGRILTYQHAVFVGVSGVLNDGDDIRTFFGYVDEIAAGPVRELHSVHQTLLPNKRTQ